MSLIYTLVAKEPDTVLCGESTYHGNFEMYAQKLLKKIQSNTRGAFQQDEYVNIYKSI